MSKKVNFLIRACGERECCILDRSIMVQFLKKSRIHKTSMTNILQYWYPFQMLVESVWNWQYYLDYIWHDSFMSEDIFYVWYFEMIRHFMHEFVWVCSDLQVWQWMFFALVYESPFFLCNHVLKSCVVYSSLQFILINWIFLGFQISLIQVCLLSQIERKVDKIFR